MDLLLMTASCWKAQSSSSSLPPIHESVVFRNNSNNNKLPHPRSMLTTLSSSITTSSMRAASSSSSSTSVSAKRKMIHTATTTTTTSSSPTTNIQKPPSEIIHARLDGSLHCSQCHASHPLYLMYPIIKTLDTWNEENQYLCPLCRTENLEERMDEEEDHDPHHRHPDDPHHHNNQDDDESNGLLADDSHDNDNDEKENMGGHINVGTRSKNFTPVPGRSKQEQQKQKQKQQQQEQQMQLRRLPQIPLITHDSCDVQECLDLLHEVEQERDVAMERISYHALRTLRQEIKEELDLKGEDLHHHDDDDDDDDDKTDEDSDDHSDSSSSSSSSSSSQGGKYPPIGISNESFIRREIQIYVDLWKRHWDLLTETVFVIHQALELQGDEECDLLLAYYQWQCRPDAPSTSMKGACPEKEPEWKKKADQVLHERDVQAGVGPGHFWGSSARTDHSPTDSTQPNQPHRILLPSPDDEIIEELASPEQSLFIQLFVPHNRGLGWNATQSPQMDSSQDILEAYKAEAGIVKCVPRTERQDRDLTIQEHTEQVRTILVRVAEKITSPLPQPPPPVSPSEVFPTASQPPRSRTRRGVATPTPTSHSNGIPSRTNYGRFFPVLQEKAQTEKQLKPPRPSKGKRHIPHRHNYDSEVVATPQPRTGPMYVDSTIKKRLHSDTGSLPSRETDGTTITTTSKRQKTIPIVSAIKASPKKVERVGCSQPQGQPIMSSSTDPVTSQGRTPDPNIKNSRPERPYKHPRDGSPNSTTKKSADAKLSSPVARVVGWSPACTLTETPASCTRSKEKSPCTTRPQGGGEGEELHYTSGYGVGTMLDLAGNRGRAPRRCMRCVEFGAVQQAFLCKGRGGQRNCNFFDPNGDAYCRTK